MEIKCPRCGYAWNYKGRLGYARCGYCKAEVKVDECKVEDTGGDNGN